ncbi:MAG: TIR domain-containing protein [Hyphomicrobiaceae bacterium]
MAKLESAGSPQHKPRVFFCYSGKDKALAERLRDALADDIDLIKPDTLSSGGSVAEDHDVQFAATDIVLLIATEAARADGFVVGDVRFAINANKPLVIVQVNGTRIAEWNPFDNVLLTYPALPLSSDGTVSTAFVNELARSLRESIAGGQSSFLPDNLKRISRIGVLIEKRLNELGVARYEQIAGWTEKDIRHFSAALRFDGPDRIREENWVEQAQILAVGGLTEYARRVDRGEVNTADPLEQRKPKAFLSYSRKDKAEAETLARRLDGDGIDVYWDRRLQIGDPWDEKLEEWRQAADAIVVLWSENAIASRWVQSEARFGFENRKLLSVLASRFSPAGLPRPFIEIQALPIERVLADPRELADAIRKLTARDGSGSTKSAEPERPRHLDVFLAYSSKDRERVRAVRNTLTQLGLEVFADGEVPADEDWNRWILTNLSQARCVIALWSANAVKSQHVIEEVAFARVQGKLVEAMLEPLDGSALPLGSGTSLKHDLALWNGAVDDPHWMKLIAAVEAKLGRRVVSPPAQASTSPPEASSTTADGKFVPFNTLKKVVSLATAVAAIKDASGQARGTGFLVSAADVSPALDPNRSYLLTNGHVVWDGGAGPSKAGALRPADVRIAIEPQPESGASGEYRCARVVWQSPPDALDAVLIELDRPTPGSAPLVLAPRDRLLVPGSTQLALIGHATDGSLSLSTAGPDNLKTILFDKGPRGTTPGPEFLHYQTRVAATQTGCPVIEIESWTVLGLHRENAFVGRPNLNGKPGTNNASEGIWIHSILDAITRGLVPVLAARAWAANGRPASALLSARRLKAIEAQLAAEPLAPSMAEEVAPFLAASRRAVAGRHAGRLRAMAAALALLPIVIAAGAHLWISRMSVALTPPMPAASRIGGFLDPGAKSNGPLEQARAAAGHLLAPPHAHATAIRDLALSPDGKLAAVLDASNTVRLWELETGKMRWEHHLTADRHIHAVTCNKDAVIVSLFAEDAETVQVFSLNFETGISKELEGGLGQSIAKELFHSRSVQFSTFKQPETGRLVRNSIGRFSEKDRSGDSRFLVGHADGTVSSDVEELPQLNNVHAGSVRAVALSTDAEHGATAASDGSVVLWRAPITATTAPYWWPIRLDPPPAFNAGSALIFNGSTKKIQAVQYSPDGTRLVTASSDGSAWVWDAKTGLPLCSAAPHAGIVWTASFSPDGRRIVTASEDQTARILDAADCRQLAVLEGHTAAVTKAAFSPDGRRIVTASRDNSARVWDVATGKPLTLLKGHGDWVLSAAFSPDGTLIATASADASVRIWDAATGQERARLAGHKEAVHTAVFSPDGKTLVTASLDARIWEVGTGKDIALLRHDNSVAGVSVSADGTRIVTASNDNTARVWDARTGAMLLSLAGPREVSSARFSPDGRMILTASGDRTARLWDATTGAQLAEHQAGEKIIAADFAPDSQSVVIADFDKALVIPVTRPACGGPCSSVAFLGDGSVLLTAGWGGKAQLWAQKPKSLVPVNDKGPNEFRQIAELDHGAAINRAFLAGEIIDAQTSSFPPIITIGDDGVAKAWTARHTTDWTNTATVRGHDAPITHAAVTPDGRRLVTGDMRGAVRVTDLDAAAVLSRIDPTPTYQRHVAPVVARADAMIAGWANAASARLTAWVPAKPLPVPPVDPAAPVPQAAKPNDPPSQAAAPQAPGLTDEQVAALVSEEAKQMVVTFEVVSRDVYEKKYFRAVWPGGATGITIGINYDLGYYSAEEIRRDWQGVLPAGQIEALTAASGLFGEAAGTALAQFRDISVPWDAALAVFTRSTLPRFSRLVLTTFPNAAELNGHAFGALVSLLSNRGSSLMGDGRVEMRNIDQHMTARAFEKIPAEIRAMKRLFPDARGLVQRREAEARLFERGLEAMGIAPLPVANEPAAQSAPPATRGITAPKAAAPSGAPAKR